MASLKAERSKRYAAAHPERVRAQRAAWVSANRDRVNAWRQRWRDNNRGAIRAYDLRTRRARKLLPTPTRPMPALCECCSEPPTGRYTTLALDHNHETGAFRGWLCHRCNFGLGYFGDSVAGLTRALNYLVGKP